MLSNVNKQCQLWHGKIRDGTYVIQCEICIALGPSYIVYYQQPHIVY